MKVSVGISSIIGWLSGILGMLPIIIKVIQEGSAITVAGPEKYLALFAVIMAGLTQIGRYLQAHALAKGVAEEVPTTAAIAAESRAIPDGAQVADPPAGV